MRLSVRPRRPARDLAAWDRAAAAPDQLAPPAPDRARWLRPYVQQQYAAWLQQKEKGMRLATKFKLLVLVIVVGVLYEQFKGG